ncbi:hypothetical protein E2F43_15950 [Seongchinamella unica]|uniref:Uncharacterized protein n=1 Tax=Seongchinamella unica TaxID=2547392 RepID=A0A4R5LNL7_9GAMM|nr:hypothetical protein [Seongchinamella unica]TDG11860.1 hypothetical protein E2F43_15950 [Seongchinamella unica]
MHIEYGRFLFILCLLPAAARGDGSSIDKVYHPYVEQLEWELEWRLTHADENPLTGTKGEQKHRFGLGRAVSEFVFIEGYLIAEDSAGENFDLAAYEFDFLWQLSEQGEYSLDYGLLLELEKTHNEDVWEFSTTLLLEREFGRFSGTANLGVEYEWGEGIQDEVETSLALQTRYRYSPRLEPAVELYTGEDTLGVGPVLLGMERLGPMKALRWEAGAIFGLDSDTADYTLRAVLEYEF